MMQFLKDIISFIHTLSFIDYILYFSVLTLIVLVISLIYILKNNDKELLNKPVQNELDDEIDLKNIVKTIDESPKPIIDMTEYENEQEEKAIISYEELLKTAQIPIQYEEEEYIDNEVQVKKIDLEKLSNNTKDETKTEMKVIAYQHEEEFLKTLKQLNKLLN